MSNVVKARLRIARSIKNTLGNRWTAGKPIVTTDTGELYVGLGDNADAIKITDFIQIDNLPLSGFKNKIYIKNGTNQIYTWDGSKFNILQGNGGSTTYATFSALPTVGKVNNMYIVLSDENFFPTSGKSIYVWDVAISKYVLCSRAVSAKSFSSIKVNGTVIGAKNKQDQLEIKADDGLSIVGDASTNTITIRQTSKPVSTVSKLTYDLKGGTLPDLPIKLSYTQAETIGDDIYILGGYNGSIAIDTVYKYNITTNEMTQYGTLPSPRYQAMSCVYNGNIYIFGGRSNVAFDDFWMYDVTLNTWTEKPKMLKPKFGSYYAVVGDKLWVFGGREISSSTLTTTIEYYDFIIGGWTQIDPSTASLSKQKYAGNTFVFGNQIYCIGGKLSNDANLTDVEVFDTETLSWIVKNPLPVARWGCGAGVYNGLGYLLLGGYSTTSVRTIYAYNPTADTWCAISTGPTAKTNFAVALYENRFYMFGGNTGTSSPYYSTCNSYAVMSGKSNNYAILNVVKPSTLTVTNISTTENGRIMALSEDDIWQCGTFEQMDASIILTEKQS